MDLFGPAQVDRRLESLGSNTITHFEPPTPPPVRSRNLSCACCNRVGSVSRSSRVAAIVLAPKKIPGLIAAGSPPSALCAQARVFVAGARRAQPRPNRQELHGRRMPSVIDIVVRGVVGLPLEQRAAPNPGRTQQNDKTSTA